MLVVEIGRHVDPNYGCVPPIHKVLGHDVYLNPVNRNAVTRFDDHTVALLTPRLVGVVHPRVVFGGFEILSVIDEVPNGDFGRQLRYAADTSGAQARSRMGANRIFMLG